MGERSTITIIRRPFPWIVVKHYCPEGDGEKQRKCLIPGGCAKKCRAQEIEKVAEEVANHTMPPLSVDTS